MKANKVIGLESLRGICAILVAFGHILHWSNTAQFENWLIYGVCVFFSISGAVLYVNYNKIERLDDFIIKRIARLSPLYIFSMAATYVGHNWPVGWDAVFNLPMTFGLFQNRCAVTGCWSLGVEFVLYLLFPTLLAFTNNFRSCSLMLVFLLCLRIAGIEDAKGHDWWSFYINPGNFAFLFFGGMVIAKYADLINLPKYLLIMISIFCFISLFGFRTNDYLVFGFYGFFYPIICIVLVFSFWSIRLPLSNFLGQISYGMYLLHPIVWGLFHTVIKLPVWACLAITLPVTAIFSWVMLIIFEIPARRYILKLWNINKLPSIRHE